jgi:hypothetical protein
MRRSILSNPTQIYCIIVLTAAVFASTIAIPLCLVSYNDVAKGNSNGRMMGRDVEVGLQ